MTRKVRAKLRAHACATAKREAGTICIPHLGGHSAACNRVYAVLRRAYDLGVERDQLARQLADGGEE